MSEKTPADTGLVAVIKELDLAIPSPSVRSRIVSGARRTRIDGGIVYEDYPKSYASNELYGHIKFALRYEPIDLGIYEAIFRKLDAAWFERHIKGEPSGIYARRLWYLYELLIGEKLDLKDVSPTGYVDLLDAKRQFTGASKKISRQRINDNLLGTLRYCPLIRRTEKLERLTDADLKTAAAKIVEDADPILLARAVQFLYTKETKSSFAIEGERLSPRRGERFVEALRRASDFDVFSKRDFIKLQNLIADARYAESDWRAVQNFVGRTMSDFREQIHFVCPKPEDVSDLMNGWTEFVERAERSEIDPVILAASAAFGFVFVHPFEDGNGRIHRFLVHHFLSRTDFTPPGVLFPVSAAMLRSRRNYDAALEKFSSRIQPFVEYSTDREGRMTVENETARLYRFWDATTFAEYLYELVAETIQIDLKEEIGFLNRFDAALEAVAEIVEMPDRKASLLVRFIMQNRGKLSNTKREKFNELTDEEIDEIEKTVRGERSAFDKSE
jgi:Fic family protein